LEQIPTVGDVIVSRSEAIDQHGFSWSVTFLDSEWWNGDKYYDVPELSLSNLDGSLVTSFSSSVSSATQGSTFGGSFGTITVASIVEAMNGFEQQAIRIEANAGSLQGVFSLSMGDESTSYLDVDSSEEDIQVALSALPTVGQVVVKRMNTNSALNGLQLLVVFVENLGNIPMLSADISRTFSSEASGTISVYYEEVVSGVQPILQSQYYNYTIVPVLNDKDIVTVVAENLLVGVNYHVRVSAWNGANFAYGAVKGSTPAILQPAGVPGLVTETTLGVISDDSVRISWKPPSSWNAVPIYSSGYDVEYDYLPTVKEVQSVSIVSSLSPSVVFVSPSMVYRLVPFHMMLLR